MGIRRAVCTVCTVVLVWCGAGWDWVTGGRAALEFKSKTSSRVEEKTAMSQREMGTCLSNYLAEENPKDFWKGPRGRMSRQREAAPPGNYQSSVVRVQAA